jgi:hypothetical protein
VYEDERLCRVGTLDFDFGEVLGLDRFVVLAIAFMQGGQDI